MNKKEIISTIGRPILRPVGLLQAAFLLTFLVSIFILIWGTWNLAWKVGLTGIIGAILCNRIYKLTWDITEKAVDEAIEAMRYFGAQKTKFMNRVEELLKK